jgi:hypothetical protein
MKTELKRSLGLFLGIAVSCGLCPAQSTDRTKSITNSFHICFSGRDSGFEVEHYAVRQAIGAKIPEILPSAQDSEGHWGEPTNGLQVSLRFRRGEFLRGEPVQAVAILRNLFPTTRTLVMTNGPGYENGVSFIVCFGTNELLSLRPEEPGRFRTTGAPSNPDFGNSFPTLLVGLGQWDLSGMAEKLIAVNLDRFFDLTRPGDYSVQAVYPVFGSETNPERSNVVSGKVSFRRVDAMSSNELKEKIAWDEKLRQMQRRFDELRQSGQPTSHP